MARLFTNHAALCVGSLAILVFVASASLAQLPKKKTHLTLKDRDTWRPFLKIPKDCEDAFQRQWAPGTKSAQITFYNLGRQEYLVEVGCYSGAYDPGFIFVYLNEQKPSEAHPLKLKGYDSADDNGKPLPYSELTGSYTFNQRTHTLEILTRYRGIGDCGLFVRYKFDGPKASVLEARERDCDDSRVSRKSINYQTWPKKKL